MLSDGSKIYGLKCQQNFNMNSLYSQVHKYLDIVKGLVDLVVYRSILNNDLKVQT